METLKVFMELIFVFFLAFMGCHYTLATFGVRETVRLAVAIVFATIFALLMTIFGGTFFGLRG